MSCAAFAIALTYQLQLVHLSEMATKRSVTSTMEKWCKVDFELTLQRTNQGSHLNIVPNYGIQINYLAQKNEKKGIQTNLPFHQKQHIL